MFRSTKIKYESLEEWRVDFEKMHDHPNDIKLMNAIVKRLEASTQKIQQAVKDYLMSENLLTNPWYVFNQVTRECPNHSIVVRTKEDPWFGV